MKATQFVNLRILVIITTVVGVSLLLLATGETAQSPAVVQAQPDSANDEKPLQDEPCPSCCTDTCTPPIGGCCVACGTMRCDDSGGGGGGGNPPPPQPTQPPGGGGGGTPQATTVAGTPGAPAIAPTPVICGDGNCTDWETYASCSADCEPPDWREGEFTMYCAPYSACDSGWANLTVLYIPSGDYYVITVHVCLDESACVAPTPEPNVTPETTGLWPCDYPPTVDASGVIRQPCEQWPGWYIDVEVRIPPAPVLRNPWPRGLVGLENCFWYLGNADNEKWSEEKAVECPNAADGVTHDSATFDCGNGTIVGEGAVVDHQIGAAWRQWRYGDDPVFGYTPPDEVTWVIEDREWNGGTTMRSGPTMCYTFETSSFGLEEWGPVWNPECQDEECDDCDERILDYLGSPAYEVDVNTFWWPEYSFKHLEYSCSSVQWSDCFWRETAPLGQKKRSCSSDEDGPDGWWYGQVGFCEEWKWTQVKDAWTPYELTQLGFANPLLASTGVVVAGADAAGDQCGEFTDRWECLIPVPVIEIQPVGAGGSGW